MVSPLDSFFLGAQGVISLLLLWPVLIAFHFTGLERLEAPPALVQILFAIRMLGDNLIGAADFFGIQFVSPLFITVGSNHMVPLMIFFESLRLSYAVTLLSYIGMGLLTVGSILVIISAFLFPAPQRDLAATENNVNSSESDVLHF